MPSPPSMKRHPPMPRDGGHAAPIDGAHGADATGLILPPSSLRRVAHLLASLWDKRRRLHRLRPVLAELAAASIGDARAKHRGGDCVRGCYAGRAPPCPGRRLAIYAHYSPSGHVHEMTLRQLALYGASGFDVVFVTMCPELGGGEVEALLPLTRLVVHRQSFGRDFGAWRDGAALMARDTPAPTELLLANDSVLGPLRPVDRLIERMRDRGPGLIGLTDSRMGPPHLQSYFLLAVGEEAVADVLRFLARLKLSQSGWLMVRRGEYALTRFMAGRGHTIVSMFAYDDVLRAAASGTVGYWNRAPVNPTHHAWRTLIEEFDFPFVKRDLLTKNPNRVRGVDEWPTILPPDGPVDAATIRSYLAEMAGRDEQGVDCDA